MDKKLSKYGNSLALIIDKPILELLRIKEDTILQIETDGDQLIIRPKRNNEKVSVKKMRDPKLQQIVEDILDEYSETFKKLADN
jgi:antitoxin MazE